VLVHDVFRAKKIVPVRVFLSRSDRIFYKIMEHVLLSFIIQSFHLPYQDYESVF
jgi:hypothetical protein